MGSMIKNFFVALRQIFIGDRTYYLWVAFLSFFILMGISAYVDQLHSGLIVTAMRDQVSWGLYISNFTFLVGVAAAAVLLVVPAYVYNFKPIKEIVLFGVLLAITAITMCLMFIMVDMGQPLRAWHILPVVGSMHFPASLLAWDVVVLNGYLAINVIIAFYVLYRLSIGKEYSMAVIRAAHHSVRTMGGKYSLYRDSVLIQRHIGQTILGTRRSLLPGFLASAFCSGPAIMLVLFQIIRKRSEVEIDNRAIFKIAELIAYAMAINLFLLGLGDVQGILFRRHRFLFHDLSVLRPSRENKSRPLDVGSDPV